MISTMVILGAGGDLTSRYLLPALGRLMNARRLPPDFSVLGASREHGATEAFRERMSVRLAEHAPELPVAVREALLGRLEYGRADVTDTRDLGRLLGKADQPLLVYLALPPAIYKPTMEALCEAGLPAGSRVVIEKPFGRDLESAQALNRLIVERLGEESVFRIDHFLGMQTVQNILGLRFANRIFETLWNGVNVERVEIVWDETLALEGRAGYYDATGALLDMAFEENAAVPNLLRLNLAPERIALALNITGPGERLDLRRFRLLHGITPPITSSLRGITG